MHIAAMAMAVANILIAVVLFFDVQRYAFSVKLQKKNLLRAWQRAAYCCRSNSLIEAKYGVVCCLPTGKSAMSMPSIGVLDFKLKPR